MSFTRRSFIEKLSLGTGAALLSSLAEGLVREARGQASARKRIVFVISGNGWNADNCYVKGYQSGSFKATSSFELPASLAPLAKHKGNLLVTDGLMNGHSYSGTPATETHMLGFSALSCKRGANTPGEQTFDQYLAETLGKDAAFKWVGLCATDDPKSLLTNHNLSATGAGKPVAYQAAPREAFNALFGGGSGSTAANNTPDGARIASLRKKSVFDFMLNDIARTQATLAGPEKAKLDEYLTSLRALESRRARQLEDQATNTISCNATAPTLSNATVEDALEGHFAVASMALVCGLTQVVVISAGAAGHFSQYYRRLFSEPLKSHSWGHREGDSYGLSSYNKVHAHTATQIASLADKLAATREGDASVLDNSTIVWFNDGGAIHHSDHKRQPAVILGRAGGYLKTDGRYINFPNGGQPERQSFADLYITLSHAMGVPNDEFGKNGIEPVKGIIKPLV